MRPIDADKAVEQIDDIFSVVEGNTWIPVGLTKALVRMMLTVESITPTVGGCISAEEKTGARLMSREDMKKIKGYTPIWEEIFNLDYGTDLLPAIVGHGEIVAVEGTFDLDKPWIFETEYTKIRYWDAKPTEEERKAEPWQEEVTGDA